MDLEYPAAVLTALARLLDGSGSLWVVGGSTGLALRGASLDRPPRDLDIYADEDDIPGLHAALAGYALDGPAASETARYRSILAHYSLEGTVVELVGAFRIQAADSVYLTEVRRMLYPAGESYDVGGGSVRLVPPAHELIFNALRERTDRCVIAGSLIRKEPERHLPVLESLLTGNEISEETADVIRRFAAGTFKG